MKDKFTSIFACVAFFYDFGFASDKTVLSVPLLMEKRAF